MIHTAAVRQRLYVQLDPEAWGGPGMSPLNLFLSIAILASTVLAVVSTEPLATAGREPLFRAAELAFGAVFLVEYAARLWVAIENEACGPIGRRRLRHALSLPSLIDLAVLIVTFAPMFVANAQLLRLVRLLRILQVTRLGRLSRTFRYLIEAVLSRKYELGLTAMVAMVLMLVGASALYWIEGELQPDKFGSIPRALWWAVITLTTIGYGDVYPVTPAGKVVAATVAFSGIGLIAMPTGILAAAFSDAVQRDGRPKQ